MTDKKIRILIVDSTAEKRLLYRSIFEENALLTVVNEFKKGKEAIDKAKDIQADIIVMSVELSDMDGSQATKEILETVAVPIILVARTVNQEITNKAQEAGALAVTQEPNPNSSSFEQQKKELHDTVICMSEVRVVTRRMDKFFKNAKAVHNDTCHLTDIQDIAKLATCEKSQTMVAIGVSTGGPPLIATILSEIKKDFSLPVCIIQHISDHFTDSMVSWLSTQSNLPVQKISDGMKIIGGNVYIAPGGVNTIVSRGRTFKLVPPTNLSKPTPSVNEFFISLKSYYGKDTIAILLTGMGNDGAEGLTTLKNAGAQTIVQDKESCVVYGMPEAALKMDAAKCQMTPKQIITLLNYL